MYLDTAATMPISKESLMNITNHFETVSYNPSSLYSLGQKAHRMVESSRKAILKHINGNCGTLYFTSGGSEANTWAIIGLSEKFGAEAIVTTRIEHESILNCVKKFKNVYYVDVNCEGIISSESLDNILKKLHDEDKCKNVLVSIQFVNNEIGTIQDIKKLADITHKYHYLFHTDAVQALPHLNIDIENLKVDAMSISGHKIGATKGIGALWVVGGINIDPYIYGGKQEYGIRGGTENTVGIFSFIDAIKRIESEQYVNHFIFRNAIINRLKRYGTDFIVNGSVIQSLPNILSVSFKGVDGDTLMSLLDSKYGIQVSTGSACCAGIDEVSHVLKAIRCPKDYIYGTIRLSWDNGIGVKTIRDCTVVADCIMNCIEEIKKLQTPLDKQR